MAVRRAAKMAGMNGSPQVLFRAILRIRKNMARMAAVPTTTDGARAALTVRPKAREETQTTAGQPIVLVVRCFRSSTNSTSGVG